MRWLWVMSLLMLMGCARQLTEGSYAAHESPGNYGMSGLAVFEKLCNQAGIQLFTAARLSPRLERADCILLIGDTNHPPGKDARDWMEAWLARKSGRSVVYFGRDFSAEVFYRTTTLNKVSSESAHRAAIELASARARQDSKLVSEITGNAFCRWFEIKALESQRDITRFQGPWATALDASARWPVRVWLDTPDSKRLNVKPAWVPPPTVTTWTGWSPAKTSRTRDKRSSKNVIYQSLWNETEINDDATWESEWSKAPDADPLLSAQDGTPLVTRLTSERYADSQIITLANAAPLLNVSIVQPHFMKISEKLIQQLGSIRRVAVLRFDRSGISISELGDKDDEVAGLSVLTTYPMNIIIVHLAFLGLVVCLALFPILGRAQALPPEPVSDFGQHAQALGQMLERTGDVQYATKTVAEYVKLVRGEALPTWLQSAVNQFMPRTEPIAQETVVAGADSTIRDSKPEPSSENVEELPHFIDELGPATNRASVPNADAAPKAPPPTTT